MSFPRRTVRGSALIALLVLTLGLAGLLEAPGVAADPQAPSVPRNVVATPHADRTVTVTWDAPSDPGSSAITSYWVQSDEGGALALVNMPAPLTATFTMNDISASQPVIFSVEPWNSNGAGPPGSAAPVLIPAVKPDTPASVTITDAPGDPSISWIAGDNGGSPVTSSTITAQPGGQTVVVSGPGTGAAFPGLTHGTSYTFSITSTNSAGTSDAATSGPYVPWGAPSPPTNVKAVRGNKTAKVTWSASVPDGKDVDSYLVQSTTQPGPSAIVLADEPLTKTFTGLTNGRTYRFVVKPYAAFTQFPGTISNAAIPAGAPLYVPGLAVSTGIRRAVLTWRAAPTNGAAITKYVIVASNGRTATVGASARRYVMLNLGKGKRLRFRIRAYNAVGAGPLSPWSRYITIK